MNRFIFFFIVFPWLKFRMNWIRFLVMALPIVLLAAMLTGINILNTSISHIIDNKILPVVDKQERIITLGHSLGEQDDFFFNINSNSLEFNDRQYDNFKPEEVETLATVTHTTSVGRNLDAITLLGETEDLLEGHRIIFNNFSGLSPEIAQHLEFGDFTYTPGKVLPVVLGVDALKEYKTGILHADTLSNEVQQELLDDYQEHTTLLKKVEDKSTILNLVGQEFVLQLGKLQWQPVLYRIPGGVENTFEFIPAQTRHEMQQRYDDEINRYWDVERLKQGVSIKARVVGIDTTINTPAISVPNQAVSVLHQQLAKHLTQSLHSKGSMPTLQEIGNKFRGVVVNEGQIGADGGYLYFVDLPNQSTELPGIFIPGLYYQSTDAEESVARQLTADEVGSMDFPIHQAVVVADSMDSITPVWNNLHAMGYSSGKATVNNFRYAVGFSAMMKDSTEVLKIPFMVVALIVVFFLMLRVAKSSDYETGVVRMLGATKDQVLLIFSGFFTQQLVLSSVLGVVIGYGLMVIAAPFIIEAFLQQNQFKLEDIAILYGKHITISGSDLTHLDILSLASDLGLVLVVALIGLLSAALLVARIQPHVLVNNNRE